MSRTIGAAARLYRLLLRLYPRPFQAAFGDEMCAVFAAVARDAEARGWPSLLAVCAWELAGLVLNAPLAWGYAVREWRGRGAPSKEDGAALARPGGRTGGSQGVAIGGVSSWLTLRRLPLVSLAGLTLATLVGVMALFEASPRRLGQSVAAVRIGTDASHVWISGHDLRCAEGVAPNHVVCGGEFEGRGLEVAAWIHDEIGAPMVSGCRVIYDGAPRRCRAAYDPYTAGWLPFVIVEETLGVGEGRLRELRLRDPATNASEGELGVAALMAASLFAVHVAAIVFQRRASVARGWRRALWGVVALGGGAFVFVLAGVILLLTLFRLGYMD